jgi:hypothetical protein
MGEMTDCASSLVSLGTRTHASQRAAWRLDWCTYSTVSSAVERTSWASLSRHMRLMCGFNTLTICFRSWCGCEDSRQAAAPRCCLPWHSLSSSPRKLQQVGNAVLAATVQPAIITAIINHHADKNQPLPMNTWIVESAWSCSFRWR